MPSDSDRLLAAGAPITLIDGREVRLRYGMRAMKNLEDELGSIEAVHEAVNGTGKKFGPLVTVIYCGLSHEQIEQDDLFDLLDTRRLEEYSEAIGAAFHEAFPAAQQDPPQAEVVQLPAGLGQSGTTPAQSSSAVPTGTSG